jgi:peptidoglycan/LPS O-acetylase OafA/YrhL
VLKFFWTPFPHAPSYFVGLLLGYALYNRSISQLTRRQVRLGWLGFAICYAAILCGTYSWNKNAPYSREAATAYYNLSQIFWALSTGWAILACALGEGGWLNDFLSSPVFIPLGRATYMTYLSHMLIVMSYPAKMNQLIEPSLIVFLYIFIANLVLSYSLGICLTLVYESPILHLQKLLVARMASKFNEDPRMKRGHNDDERAVRVSLYTQTNHQVQQQNHNHHHHLLSQQTLDTGLPLTKINPT